MGTKLGEGDSRRDREVGFLSCGLPGFRAPLHSQHSSVASLRATFLKGRGQMQCLPGKVRGKGREASHLSIHRLWGKQLSICGLSLEALGGPSESQSPCSFRVWVLCPPLFLK